MRKLLLLFFLTTLPLTASAYDAEINGIYYNLDVNSKTATVTAGVNSYEGDFVIPEIVMWDGVDYTVTAIAEDAFYSFVYTGHGYRTVQSHITSVTIPKSVISIGNAFYLSKELTSIVVDENNKVYDSRNNCNSIIETATNKLIVGCVNSVIPSDIVIIGENAFYRRGLTKVDLPEGLKEIQDHAFSGNKEMQSVVLPNTLTTIGTESFSYCNLKSIEIPVSLNRLGTNSSSFEGNMNLEKIVVAEGNQCFSSPGGCNAIVNTRMKSIVQGCSSTVIPEGITKLDYFSFRSTGIKKLVIPEGVGNLGDYTFYGCERLEEITFPSTTSFIGSVAFYDCISLKKIYCYLKEPLELSTLYSGPFGCNGDDVEKVYKQATLYVPKGTKSRYESAEIWNKFINIEEMEDPKPGGDDGDDNGEGKVDEAGLQVWMSDDQVVTISLDEEPKTTYSDGKLIITTSKTAVTYPLEDVRKFTYVIPNRYLPGDADGNGIVDYADVIEVSNKILGKPSANFVEVNADFNGDHIVNSVDIVLIVNSINTHQ